MQLRDMHNNRMFNESNQSVQHIGFNATAHRSYFAIGNNFRLARRSRRSRNREFQRSIYDDGQPRRDKGIYLASIPFRFQEVTRFTE